MMTHFGTHPSPNLADDPSDPVWYWFIFNGPHGDSFQWRRNVGNQGDIVTLRNFIEEKAESIPDFKERARRIAIWSLEIKDVLYIRKAIQVLTAIGTEEDLNLLKKWTRSPNETVAIDAKSGLFERGIKGKKNKR